MNLLTTFVALSPAGNGVDDGTPAGPHAAVVAFGVILLLMVVFWVIQRYLSGKPPKQD